MTANLVRPLFYCTQRHLSSKSGSFFKNVLIRDGQNQDASMGGTATQGGQGTLIWLPNTTESHLLGHGRGAGDDSKTFPHLLQMTCPFWCRIVLPTPPLRTITALQGQDVHAWYDFRYKDAEMDIDDGMFDPTGFHESVKAVHGLIDAEIERAKGTPLESVYPQRIVLAGLGQGGVVALHAGLTYRKQLKAVGVFNGWIVMEEAERAVEEDKGTFVFGMNGEDNPSVDADFVQEQFIVLKGMRKGGVSWEYDFEGKRGVLSNSCIHKLSNVLESMLSKNG